MFFWRISVVTASCSAGIYIGYKCSKNIELLKSSILPNIYAKSASTFSNESIGRLGTTDVQSTFPNEATKNKVISNIGDIVKYGFPSTDNLRSYEDFILSYDRRTRTASWVLEHLTQDKVNRVDGVERSKMKFLEDQSIHGFHRATNKDYQGSGYDRGHLAAAANHRHSMNAMSQTFFLSNIAPQVGAGFNRDSWNSLEKYIRALARINKNVFVCTGPLYLPRKEQDGKLYVKYEVIGENHVAVPTHFFKTDWTSLWAGKMKIPSLPTHKNRSDLMVVVIENKQGHFELQSYVMPNQSLPDVILQNYLVPLEVIERAAGLLFFQNIPKNTFKKINNKPI